MKKEVIILSTDIILDCKFEKLYGGEKRQWKDYLRINY